MVQILMLSGVGPAEHLYAHDIPVVADLPGVGSHLLDHPVVDVNFLDKTGSSIMKLDSQMLQHKLQTISELVYYNLTGKGMLTTNVRIPSRVFTTLVELVGSWLRSSPSLAPRTPRSSRPTNSHLNGSRMCRPAQVRRTLNCSVPLLDTSKLDWRSCRHATITACMLSCSGEHTS